MTRSQPSPYHAGYATPFWLTTTRAPFFVRPRASVDRAVRQAAADQIQHVEAGRGVSGIALRVLQLDDAADAGSCGCGSACPYDTRTPGAAVARNRRGATRPRARRARTARRAPAGATPRGTAAGQLTTAILRSANTVDQRS